MANEKSIEKITVRDLVNYVVLAASVGLHFGTFLAVKETVERHSREIKDLQTENARQETDIQILHVRVKGNRK
jgi:hypothetical protein